MHQFHLPDMSCGHCVATITKTLRELDPQVGIEIDAGKRELRVQSALAREPIALALTEAGYPPA